jgi:hypothetical protein
MFSVDRAFYPAYPACPYCAASKAGVQVRPTVREDEVLAAKSKTTFYSSAAMMAVPPSFLPGTVNVTSPPLKTVRIAPPFSSRT